MIRRPFPGLVLFAVCMFQALNAAANSPAPKLSAEDRTIGRVVQLTNEIRVQHGLAPLQVHPALSKSARWMAQDMVQHDYLRHTDFLGREIDPRLPEFGYEDYREIGENIAGGQLTPEEVVADWMKSPGHRANLLNPNFREIGVAHLVGTHTHYKHYWVQDFGMRSDSYPVVINNKAAETRDPTVHLYVHGKGWATQMRFSNDQVHWSDWEAYRTQRDWTVLPGSGDRTVYAEVRGEGIVRRSTDTVRLQSSQLPSLIASAVSAHAAR